MPFENCGSNYSALEVAGIDPTLLTTDDTTPSCSKLGEAPILRINPANPDHRAALVELGVTDEMLDPNSPNHVIKVLNEPRDVAALFRSRQVLGLSTGVEWNRVTAARDLLMDLFQN